MEILDTIPVYESNGLIIVISLIVMLVSAAFMGISVNENCHIVISGLFLCLAILSFGVLAATGLKLAFKKFDHYRYVIRIEDDYPISQLYEKYEIVSKDKYSNVYTVKEIGNEN